MTPTYRTASVDGLKVFYREAGDPKAPTVLLLHGFPTSSHMYRELIPALADRYHVVAPDLPGFGFTRAPDRSGFKYSFDHLAEVIERFTEVLGLESLRPLRLRLRRAGRLPPCHSTSRADHGADFAERQRVSRRVKRGMESDPDLLEGSFAEKPCGPTRIPKARNDPVAVHARRADARAAVTGCLDLGLCAPRSTWQ